jgi:hypothetical protein
MPRADSSSLSRRQAIAGLTAMTAALPATVAVAAEPDPIHAAIEARRKAQREFDVACATASQWFSPRSRLSVGRVSEPRAWNRSVHVYGIVVGLAARLLRAHDRCGHGMVREHPISYLRRRPSFALPGGPSVLGSADGPHRKILPASDRCRLVRPQVRANVHGHIFGGSHALLVSRLRD